MHTDAYHARVGRETDTAACGVVREPLVCAGIDVLVARVEAVIFALVVLGLVKSAQNERRVFDIDVIESVLAASAFRKTQRAFHILFKKSFLALFRFAEIEFHNFVSFFGFFGFWVFLGGNIARKTFYKKSFSRSFQKFQISIYLF